MSNPHKRALAWLLSHSVVPIVQCASSHCSIRSQHACHTRFKDIGLLLLKSVFSPPSLSLTSSSSSPPSRPKRCKVKGARCKGAQRCAKGRKGAQRGAKGRRRGAEEAQKGRRRGAEEGAEGCRRAQKGAKGVRVGAKVESCKVQGARCEGVGGGWEGGRWKGGKVDRWKGKSGRRKMQGGRWSNVQGER